jgi:hypothetical protein
MQGMTKPGGLHHVDVRRQMPMPPTVVIRDLVFGERQEKARSAKQTEVTSQSGDRAFN